MADRERRNLIFAHQEWLGFVQPVGLVVAPNVMVDAQVVPDRNVAERQREFRALLDTRGGAKKASAPAPHVAEEPATRSPMSPITSDRQSASAYGAREESAAFGVADEAAVYRAFDSAEERAAYRASGAGEQRFTYDASGVAQEPVAHAASEAPRASVPHRVLREWLGWEEQDLVEAANHREALEIALPELQVVLAPTWAVPGDPGAASAWMMLVRVEDEGADLDRPPDDGAGWNASRQARFERLLRETGVPTGLLCTDKRLRLVHAPRGETSGHITFEFDQMVLPAGRPILAAFDMLLSAEALFSGAPEARLPALLANSREAQAEVSTRLSRQVLAALHELLRGFITADAHAAGSLNELARSAPDRLYGGLITTLMRLVFVLYAEDRGLMPDHPVYQQHYSLGGLFVRLRSDAAAWPDTMDQCFGAWAQLLSLFRLIHGGGKHAGLTFVARKGSLFDPDRFSFLEGRGPDGDPAIPMVPDATVWNVLRSLMVLDGERLSYRTLDVEQIGSVYEAVMGFRVELTTGRSIAVASKGGATKRNGAAVVIDLDSVLGLEGGKRATALREPTGGKLARSAVAALRSAATVEDIVAALDRSIDRYATPDVVPAGTPVLQPTDERRRSGSHYTPRSLTEPIVSEALRPIFERLGRRASPEEILDLKVLDPATGSGAFLVEACRQLSARLVEAWNIHGDRPELSPDEDELLHARRLVARRCLYGVDKNPMAIDLARLSLWLVTLAPTREFTFIDHALRHGDSLVGLTCKQIEGFHWDTNAPNFQFGTETIEVRRHVAGVTELRERIRALDNKASEAELRMLQDTADREIANVRRVADMVLTAFFDGETPRERESKRLVFANLLLQEHQPAQAATTTVTPPLAAFHWELEFPEVFQRDNAGFDAVVGNPPFLGGKRITTMLGNKYRDWLKTWHGGSTSNADIVAHFYRLAFGLVRNLGCFGLIATNTIRQGETRLTGLCWICHNGGKIYRAQRRLKWPGEAAVVVSVVHISKGTSPIPRRLDGREVADISAFLFHDGGHDPPKRLKANVGIAHVGMYLRGMGFTFSNTDNKGVATPLNEMRRLVNENPRNGNVIFPFIGGDELNTDPTQAWHRYVIDFRDWPLRREQMDAQWRDADSEQRREWRREGIVPLDYPDPVAADYPHILSIVEKRVQPARRRLGQSSTDRTHAKRWWLYANDRPKLRQAIGSLDRVLAISEVGQHGGFAFLPNGIIYAHTLKVFSLDTQAAFCALQSRPHEVWARFFGSSLADALRYTPSDCFETFPFPVGWETHPTLEAAGKAYYDFRATLMIDNNEGMTDTYNRFHDPDERDPRIARLRDLHAAMDRAVLDAYGWNDIPTDCDFLLDYDIDEESWGKKKKPWRYRWPEEVRDEVLARLLALNTERAALERTAGSDIRDCWRSTRNITREANKQRIAGNDVHSRAGDVGSVGNTRSSS